MANGARTRDLENHNRRRFARERTLALDGAGAEASSVPGSTVGGFGRFSGVQLACGLLVCVIVFAAGAIEKVLPDFLAHVECNKCHVALRAGDHFTISAITCDGCVVPRCHHCEQLMVYDPRRLPERPAFFCTCGLGPR